MSEQPTNTNPPRVTLQDGGMYLFMKQVTQDSIAPVVQWIIEENLQPQEKRREHLTLIICSPGGDVNACLALIDTMNGSTIPVHTVGVGQIASCGLLMFMSGAKGQRVLTPNTSILSHQYSWGAFGKEHELYGRVQEYELTSKRLLELYKKCTGLSKDKIRKHLLTPTDVWLDAKQALELGLCDEIREV